MREKFCTATQGMFDSSTLFVYLRKSTDTMQILKQQISKVELRSLAENTFGYMVKCVADVKLGLLAIDAELHADLERLLLEKGSSLENLWGFNLYMDETGEDFVEFDALINIRAWQGNPTREISNPEVKEAIFEIIKKFIQD